MSMFGKKTAFDNSNVEEILSLRSQNQRIQSSYDTLESQYRDVQQNLSLSQKREQEALGYLYELELMLSQHYEEGKDVRLRDIQNKTPKERVKTIIEMVNKINRDNIELITQLNERLTATTRELEQAYLEKDEAFRYAEELRQNNSTLHKDSFYEESEIVQQNDEVITINQTEAEVIHPNVQSTDEMTLLIDPMEKPHTNNNLQPEINPPIENQVSYQNTKKKKEEELLKRDLIGRADKLLAENSDKFTQLMWVVIFVIGSQGLSERGEIEKYIADNMDVKTSSTTSLSTAFNSLENFGIIEKERVSTGRRNNFYVHGFTELGLGLFLKEFEEKFKPKKAEKKRLIEMHHNINHGYFIKDCKITLEEMGYTHVVDDRASNTFDVFKDGKNVWIPDIVAINDEGKKEYFECELGNHTQQDFNTKLYKASRMVKELKFIVRDKNSQTSCENLLRNWYIGLKQNSSNFDPDDLVIYLITLNNLYLRKTFGEPFRPASTI